MIVDCFLTRCQEPITFETNIRDTQVDIYYPQAISAAGFEVTGGLSLGNTIAFFGSQSIQLDSDDHIIIDNSLKNITADGYKLYPMEFYDPQTMDYIFTLDIYVEKILKLNSNSHWVDCSKVFDFDNEGDDNERLSFDTDTFSHAVNYIQNNYPNYVPIFVVVTTNTKEKVHDFFQLQSLDKIADKGVCVYSKDTIRLFYSINQYLEEKKIYYI